MIMSMRNPSKNVAMGLDTDPSNLAHSEKRLDKGRMFGLIYGIVEGAIGIGAALVPGLECLVS